MEPVQSLQIYFPGKLVFGNGCINNLGDEILQLGSTKVLIVTIEPLLLKIRVLTDHLESKSISVLIDTTIVQEPGFDDFEKLMVNATAFSPDLVIGIGGGSVLDIAKLVAAQVGNTQSLRDIVGIGLLKGRNIKMICVPATSGTGSEASPNAILVDNEDNQKKGIISRYLVPDIIYIDPLLTITVPPSITAATGLDALTHCLEAYTNKFAHPFIDMYAYEGMRLIASNLVKAVNKGDDKDARTHVAMGSLLGGICLGPVNTAGVHALSYPLGSMFHLAHGLSNALLLPHVMKYNISAVPGRYADVAIALGCARQGDDIETAMLGIEKIKTIMTDCNLPLKLSDVGVTMDSIPRMAKEAMKIQRLLKNNPREITEQDAIEIYNAAF